MLLNNLGDADPCVLERLNPCLESPIDWRLVEKGEEAPLDVHSRFRFMATMTTGQRELSPALYNRFNVVHMTPLSNDPESFLTEMRLVVSAILGGSHGEKRQFWL